MILGGMGPVDPIRTTAGKLFALFYALYSGLAIISVAGRLLAPIVQRFRHRFQSQNVSHIPGGNIATAYFRPQLPPELEFDTDRHTGGSAPISAGRPGARSSRFRAIQIARPPPYVSDNSGTACYAKPSLNRGEETRHRISSLLFSRLSSAKIAAVA
jgi:hypothetical protein